MKILHFAIIVGFGLSLMLPSTIAYAQTQQNYSHGIGSNSSALYNSVGLTYQQCQNKIANGLQKIVDSLDRGKAVAIALASPDFQAKVAGHTYELTDISTNDTWDNSLCSNVKRTAVGVSFNLLDTPNTYFESVNVAEDANMTKITEVGTETTPICSNNCPPAIPAGWSNFVPDISSDFHFNGVMMPNATIPVSVDLTNAGNSTLYNVHIAFVDSPLLQNFKTGYGNFTLQVGQEKTILGTMSTPSEISNVSSSLNWMVYANNQGNTTGSKEFNKTVNLAVKSASRDGSISYRTILPPLKQDTPVNYIECKEGLELIVKSDDYTPACVTSSTNQTLVKRGWGESLDSLKESPLIKKMEIDGLQQNYEIGQPINATVKYIGWSFDSEPDVKIFDANGSQVWFNCPECVMRTELAIPYPGVFGTYNYQVQDPNGNSPMVNKTGTYTMVATLENKTAEAEFTVTNLQNGTLTASFESCNTSYPLNNDGFPINEKGIPLLYMPKNSIGKICVNYYNILHSAEVQLRIYNMTSLSSLASGITISASQNDISNGTGNATVIYTIKTGNYSGLYGWDAFCVPLPFAVGYDNASKITRVNLTWNPEGTYFCPAGFYDFNVIGLSGIGFTMIP